MKTKLTVAAFCVVVFSNCGANTESRQPGAEVGDNQNAAASSREISRPAGLNVNQLSAGEEYVGYWCILSSLNLGPEGTEMFGSKKGGGLAFGRNAIHPPDAAKLLGSPGITPELVASFNKVNQTASRLRRRYFETQPVFGVENKAGIKEMFREIPGSLPPISAAVGLSSFGFDDNTRTGLIYGEYYTPKSGIVKFWAVLEFEDYKYGDRTNRFSRAEVLRYAADLP